MTHGEQLPPWSTAGHVIDMSGSISLKKTRESMQAALDRPYGLPNRLWMHPLQFFWMVLHRRFEHPEKSWAPVTRMMDAAGADSGVTQSYIDAWKRRARARVRSRARQVRRRKHGRR